MISINSIRSFFNGFVKRVALIPQQIHIEPYSTVEERLGLPVKPKRPAGAFGRFYADNSAKMKESNPNIKRHEGIKLCAEMWRALSDAEKGEYLNAFNEQKVEYIAQLKEYNRTLSADDKERIKNLKAKKSKRKVTLTKFKKAVELGKPKRPTNPFFKFLSERRRELGGQRHTRAEHHKFYRDTANDWHAMSESERAKYDASAELEQYKKEIVEWETEMIRSGLVDATTGYALFTHLRSESKKHFDEVKDPIESEIKT